ncbi:hypothetical protein BO221_14965 [Archangium sp. Cb G35]|uniref:DUF3466 family protein n=1 Tax=Archangium sp. Cb G35 TaxID=1920190 RepID=UPI00093715B5|nr:DUF3466 family protein [Archangium sp. Cb G35]OJT24453.1 hypothetical protein BO221_14965 [Archangium sp. Cb G35]
MRIASKLGTLAVALLSLGGVANAAPPQYTIVDLGTVQTANLASQAFRVSPAGVVTGRSLGSSQYRAYRWTQAGGLTGLPNLTSPSRIYSAGNGVNDAGVVVGVGATSASGLNPLPLIWQGGVVSQLPLPPGQSLGRANDVNKSMVAVGSVGGGSSEYGAIFSGGTGRVITQTTPAGCYLVSAFSINNNGLVVGLGSDPNNLSRNVGIVYNSVTNTATEVGALPGMNGAVAYDVSENGYVVGSSMSNQGSGTPFIWNSVNGMRAIPLPTGTSSGSARGVNSAGWAVGTASGASAVPFLFDGVNTYRLGDLLPAGSGWNLLTGTSNSAMGISDSGVIVGTGVHNGATHAYAMIPR